MKHRASSQSVKPLTLALMLFGCTAMLGCHSGFHKRFAAAPVSADADDMTGAWDGYWINTRSFHAGRLRAIVSRDGDQKYKVDFLAGFKALVIPCAAQYSIELQGTKADGRVEFTGENDLGFFFGSGGVYTYRGYADGSNWVSTFQSKSGNGEFRLKRPNRAAKSDGSTSISPAR